MQPIVHFHNGDLPEGVVFKNSVAIDTETMGLLPHRDRLCLVQISSGDGHCHLVKVDHPLENRPTRLIRLLGDPDVEKIFHFARFDVAALYKTFGVLTQPIFCTKIASKLTRTFTDRHSLKDLIKDFLKIEISKHEQTSDWGADNFTPEQQRYAATDVLYLHQLRDKLHSLLIRENRLHLAHECFKFLPHRAVLDLLGGDEFDPIKY